MSFYRKVTFKLSGRYIPTFSIVFVTIYSTAVAKYIDAFFCKIKNLMKKFITLFSVCTVCFLISCSEYDDSGYDNFYAGDINLGGDTYTELSENPFIKVTDQAFSTFSVDADGASYANVRRFLLQDKIIPPAGAVRTEELLNYFELDYPYSDQQHPINLNGEMSICPWDLDHKLIRIGIKGKPLSTDEVPNSNFVFLIDVSGSMASEDKLELLKNGFKFFVDGLSAEDKVSIVTYAGSAGVVLESTPGSEKGKIKDAINSLGSGGSTAGAEGIISAYKIAQEGFIEGGNNRVILATDGDFNVGISSQEELTVLIEEKRASGIFLTVLGVGRGNLNDAALEQIANNGNGNYEYIDNLEQLRKVFIYDYNKFYTVAKDVKVQVEFNPLVVEAYRLIGYENRLLNQEDFEDDSEDAGEIGADQNITALYEIIPFATPEGRAAITIDFRYKERDATISKAISFVIEDKGTSFEQSSDFMKFTSGVAAFSMLLTDSQYKGSATFEKVMQWVEGTNLSDENNFKSEFKRLVHEAGMIK